MSDIKVVFNLIKIGVLAVVLCWGIPLTFVAWWQRRDTIPRTLHPGDCDRQNVTVTRAIFEPQSHLTRR